MVLVDYSDSEGSESEQAQPTSRPASAKPTASTSKFSIDKANPQKIRVNLSNSTPTNGTHEDEPAAKRPRIGAGGLGGGFNAMLPPPKRDAEQAKAVTTKPALRKVFSLKTGAEPGFSRESDDELRQLFAEKETGREGANQDDQDDAIPDNIPKREAMSLPKPTFEPLKGNIFMFKPLSVARGTKTKKKPANGVTAKPSATPSTSTATTTESMARPEMSSPQPQPIPKKVSLFSSNTDQDPPEAEPEPTSTTQDQDDDITVQYDIETDLTGDSPAPFAHNSQSLDTIATDLNLSAADRRQLFGRNAKGAIPSTTAINITNFNTDAEYAANQEAIANGEMSAQHNPVRAIAPGKHSLRQLIGAAQGQKDALEESFASGRRNKREAGNKYGW